MLYAEEIITRSHYTPFGKVSKREPEQAPAEGYMDGLTSLILCKLPDPPRGTSNTAPSLDFASTVKYQAAIYFGDADRQPLLVGAPVRRYTTLSDGDGERLPETYAWMDSILDRVLTLWTPISDNLLVKLLDIDIGDYHYYVPPVSEQTSVSKQSTIDK